VRQHDFHCSVHSSSNPIGGSGAAPMYGKHKLEEEVETSAMRKRLRLSKDDDSDGDSSDLQHEHTEEEVS
jgi:hypothetical protein